MRRHIVQKYMTPRPQVISSGHTLAQARQIMRQRDIRHLPVVDEGRLVGIVSQRDLYLLETLKGIDPASETVKEAMRQEPFAVSPNAPLDEVARAMAEHRYGSAVVVDRGEVVGLFTTVDALRALARLLGRAEEVPRWTD